MQLLSYSSRDFIPMDNFVNTGGHFNNYLIKWDIRFSCLSNVSYVVDLSRVTKRRARLLSWDQALFSFRF